MSRRKSSRSGWFDRIRSPIGILLAVGGVSVLCGLLVYRHAFVVAVSVAVMLVLGLGLPVLMLAGVRGRLGFSVARCRPGEQVGMSLRLENRGVYPVTGLEAVGLPGELDLPTGVPARGSRTAKGVFVPTRRGVYPREAVRLRCGFPLGLLEREKPVEVEGGGLVVWPADVPVEMPEVDASSRQGDALLAGRRPGTIGDLTGLRPYRRGDAVREIHWRQTARHGRLIVRERQSPATPRVAVVLDADPTSYAGEAHRERAIAEAGSLYCRLLEANFHPTLVIGAKVVEESTPPATGGGTGGRGGKDRREDRLIGPMDELARLGEGGDPLSETLLRWGVRGDPMVVVTSAATAAALRGAVRPGTVWHEVAVPAGGEAGGGGVGGWGGGGA